MIQRKRLAAFFDYEHRFEAYVPKEKRTFGYFAQPVLVGDEIVAVLDLKTDRERRQAAGAEMDLARQGRARAAQEADRGSAAPLRALSARAVSRASAQVFSTFQNGTWAGSGMKPLTLARSATGGAHCPSSAIGT